MIRLIENSIKDFYIFFNRLSMDVKSPQFVNQSGILKIRYSEENIKTLCLIKTGRLISSLNAIMVLFERGYFVEIAVLLRSIKECCAELAFLLENYPNEELSGAQKQYISEFFTEEFADPSNPIKSARKHNRVTSKKVHAGFARNFYKLSKYIKNPKLRSKIQKLANPSDFQEISQKIINMYSGYVHYGYSQSTEIIGGNPPRYHLEGTSGAAKEAEWLDNLITEIVAVYNHFVYLCSTFNYQKEFIILSGKQVIFQSVTGHD